MSRASKCLAAALCAASRRRAGFTPKKMVLVGDSLMVAYPQPLAGTDWYSTLANLYGAHKPDEHGSLASAAEYLDFFTKWIMLRM